MNSTGAVVVASVVRDEDSVSIKFRSVDKNGAAQTSKVKFSPLFDDFDELCRSVGDALLMTLATTSDTSASGPIFAETRRRAENNDPQRCFTLGMALISDALRQRDLAVLESAERWLRKSDELNCEDAREMLEDWPRQKSLFQKMIANGPPASTHPPSGSKAPDG